MPEKGVFTEKCNSAKSKQPGLHCASVPSLAMRSCSFSGPAGSCYSEWELGRQILAKKLSVEFWTKISPHSIDSLILARTTFNSEQFNLECFVTFAINIFVNNCGLLAFLQSLPHVCLAASRSLRFYVTVLIFSWHNTLITGTFSPCLSLTVCEMKNIILSWFIEINHTGLHDL